MPKPRIPYGNPGWSRKLPAGPVRLVCIAALLFFSLSCGSKKKPLFTRLQPKETGVDFINRNQDTDTLNILDYLYYYNGAGVAIGDINGDGLPDIFFTSNTGENKLYLNHGGWKFEDITAKAGITPSGGWTTGVTMADVNGDGLLDIYICTVANHRPGGAGTKTYFAGARNQLYLNNGDNTFTECAAKWGLDIQGYSTQAVFFDYDKDGDLDLFVLQHSIHQTGNYGDSSARSIYSPVSGGKLYRNDGDHFTDVTQQAGIISSPLGYGLGVGVADLNHDGYDDIYVSNDFQEDDYYYVNQKNGTFKEMNRSAFGHESKFSMGNDLADVNNDGWPDVITLDMLPPDEHVLKSSVGDESFDAYKQRIKSGYSYQYSRNCLQLNIGRGARFADIGLYSGIAATDWSWSPLVADFNLDGLSDIFISNGIKKRQNDLDYEKFISANQWVLQADPSRQHDQEILARQPTGAWHSYVFEGSPDLVFTDRSLDWGLDKPGLAQGAAYGDLDGDGSVDLVTNNMNEPAGMYRNRVRDIQPDRSHFLSVQLKGKAPNSFAIGAKVFLFNAGRVSYQELQATRGFMSCSETVLHFGLAEHTVVDSLVVIWPNNYFQRMTHIAADQKLLITYGSARLDTVGSQEQFISELLHQTTSLEFSRMDPIAGIDFKHAQDHSINDFIAQPLIPHQLSTRGPKLAMGDVNGDGREDFFVCGARGQPSKLYEQQPDGSFLSTNDSLFAQDAPLEKVDAIFFDADNDGDLDLYVVSGANDPSASDNITQDRLYLNDGHGKFARAEGLPILTGNRSVVRAADIDGDGRLDLFVGARATRPYYGGIPRSYLLHNEGHGHFAILGDQAAPGLAQVGMVTDACWTDLDRDGKPDLVVVGEWMAPSIFMNRGGQLVRRTSRLDDLSGWWTCVQAVDLNQDGYPDLLLGNYGLNSKMVASARYPLKMYVGDFDRNGRTQQLLCVAKDGKYYPFRGKEDLEAVMPFLKNRFLGYSAMAGKTVEEIFGDQLKDASLLEASTMQSMELINESGKGFSPVNLPMEMQWAPIFSFYADDFNHDGKKDILAAGNFYGVIPFEGRYDAMPLTVGWGDGKGHFHAPMPQAPALLLPGEVRDMQLLRLAGSKSSCIVVARRGDSLAFITY